MDRATWLAERQAAVEADYDADAPTYDEMDDYTREGHPRFVRRLVETCPPGGTVLDAPCGTGRWFASVVEAGRHVIGIDGSAGMAAVARARGLADDVRHLRLQALDLDAAVDGAMCIDAMENVPPEDWPMVVRNLVRAVRPGGSIYLTIEEIDDAEIERAYDDFRAAGVPAVRGEVVEGDVAGYHFYPDRDRVASWLADAGLEIVADEDEAFGGWSYRHLLLRTRP